MVKKREWIIVALVLGCVTAGLVVSSQVKASEAEEVARENKIDAAKPEHPNSEIIKEAWALQEIQLNRENPVIIENREQIRDFITGEQLESLTAHLKSYFQEHNISGRFIKLPRESFERDNEGNLVFDCQFPKRRSKREPEVRGYFSANSGEYSFEEK